MKLINKNENTLCYKTSDDTPINQMPLSPSHEIPLGFYFNKTFYFIHETDKVVRVVKSIKNRAFILI